jgi:hypothetical protein
MKKSKIRKTPEYEILMKPFKDKLEDDQAHEHVFPWQECSDTRLRVVAAIIHEHETTNLPS